MLQRILIGTFVSACLAAPGLATPAATARPATQSTSCSADLTILFRPGLTLQEQAQQIRGRGPLSSCVGGGVASGTAAGSGSGTLSCTSGTASATAKIKWNTGESSQISVTIDVGNGTVTGTVTSGKFAGESVTGNLTLQGLQGDCIFTPVTRAEATGTISL
jgi:hypothetical protein